MEYFLFYLFGALCLSNSILVISAKNPIHSVFYLVLVFLNGAGLFILAGVEFLAIIFIIVYVGAIAILFLFIVMMLNIKLVELNENMLRYLPIGGLMAIIFFFEIFLLIDHDLTSLYYNGPSEDFFIPWDIHLINFSNLEVLGLHVYTVYFILFWMAGYILLVALVGAIVLTLHLQLNVKSQDVFKQSSSHFNKSTILKI
jgi:NADH-quinone oxidoreductase subunit J